MVGSPSKKTKKKQKTKKTKTKTKKQMRARDMLQFFGNLFLVRLVICYEFERV